MIEKIVGRVMAEIAAKQETKKADPKMCIRDRFSATGTGHHRSGGFF